MIAQLRTAHRVIFILAVFIGPIILVGGLYVRRLPQTMKTFPPVLPADFPVSGAWWLDDGELWGDLAMHTKLFGSRKRMILELTPSKPFQQPDILVMWQEGEEDEVHADKAYLLGSMSAAQARRFQLPVRAYNHNGRIFLYSLAFDEHIANVALPTKEAFQGEFRPPEEW